MRDREVNLVPWTDEMEALLTRLWKEGFRAESIAQQIGHGATKMSVIGKARRLKIGLHPNSQRANLIRKAHRKRSKREASKDDSIAKRLGWRKQLLPDLVPGDVERLTGNAWAPLPSSSPVEMVDLAPGRCKWPVTETKPYLFCNEPAHGSWCPVHHQAAFSATAFPLRMRA